MSTLAPTAAAGAATTAPAPSAERAQLAKAAQQFEAIFVRQMLSAARQAGFGDSLTGGQGTDTFRTMQDEHFADLAAQRGAFGLASQIEAQLARSLGGGNGQ